MNQFEYLSVLVSIIVGLGMSHLLASTARLIQRRAQIRMHGPTVCWMVLLFLANIQIWWASFERRDETQWTFFQFVLYLLIPTTVSLLSYLVLPDVEDDKHVDLAATFQTNRPWFFGLFAAVPALSLVEEQLRDGLQWDADVMFRILFSALALVAARVRSERFHLANGLVAVGLFVAYVVSLFLKLH